MSRDRTRISLDDCEIILAHRDFLPKRRDMLIAAVLLAVVVALAIYVERQSAVWALIVGATLCVVAVPLFEAFFRLKTGQAGAPNSFAANASHLVGYVAWPLMWPNSLLETRLRLAWSEVTQVALRPVPLLHAPDNFQLELTLRNGRWRNLRLPRLSDEEIDGLVGVLGEIARRSGFQFSVEPALRAPPH